MESISLPPEAEVRDYLQSFDYFEQNGRPQDGADYLRFHLLRFMRTVERAIPRLDGPVRVLELGASPYFMTLLLQRYFDFQITPANFFQDYGDQPVPPEGEITIHSKKYGEEYHYEFKMFNLELDTFPYEDASFDMVICCEILEHLALDPAHLMREAHRVLRPDGLFVLTTPNAVRLEKLGNILRGVNTFDVYSGDGVYGRHNREYTPGELGELLLVNNFHPEVHVEDAYPHGRAYRMLARLFPNRRDNLFAVGRAFGPAVEVRPSWLYLNPEIRVYVTRNRIVMGERESLQLGPGWGPLEFQPLPVRRTGREAVALLKPEGTESRLVIDAIGGPRGSRVRFVLNGHELAGGELRPEERGEIEVGGTDAVFEDFRAGRAYVLETRILVDDLEPSGNGSTRASQDGGPDLAVARIELRP